jgi:hypothetical protein
VRRLIRSSRYERAAARLLRPSAQQELEESIAEEPSAIRRSPERSARQRQPDGIADVAIGPGQAGGALGRARLGELNANGARVFQLQRGFGQVQDQGDPLRIL